jgi:propanol-preferring alcohol dehydrogenase
MRAMVLHEQLHAENLPLRLEDIPLPRPGRGEVRVRVNVCGVCRTDLHIVEGEIYPPRFPIVPGHQVVGRVEAVGDGVTQIHQGDRVGVPWLYSTDGTCDFCLRGQENLCEAGRFTGFDVNGGYAEALVIPAGSAYPLRESVSDEGAAPLLCGGVIGYRSYRLSNVKPGERIMLLGFGASAHLVLQLALYDGCEVYVITRSESHQQLARELGAAWVGKAEDYPPQLCDAAIVFAPAGALVHSALSAIRKAGTVALAGITMSDIPDLPYELIYHEKVLRSVANSTSRDVTEFLALAAQIPIRAAVEVYPLEHANQALLAVKHSRTEAAAVLQVR